MSGDIVRGAPGPAASSRLRVLVAEDETIIRLDVCSLLRAAGLEVCGEARDGFAAVGLARECEPDVAIVGGVKGVGPWSSLIATQGSSAVRC